MSNDESSVRKDYGSAAAKPHQEVDIVDDDGASAANTGGIGEKSDLARVWFIMLLLLILVGPITGPQAIFRAVAERGVFKNECGPSSTNNANNGNTSSSSSADVLFVSSGAAASGVSHLEALRHAVALMDIEVDSLSTNGTTEAPATVTPSPSPTTTTSSSSTVKIPCQAQEQKIEWAADFFLSLSNFVCVLNGILIDLIGADRMAIGGTAIWVVAKSIAGIHPENGIMWTVGESIGATVGLGTFIAVSLVHLKQACPDPKKYAFWCFLSSAFWDIAVLFNIPLSYYFRWEAVEFSILYVIYGCTIGLPFLMGLIFLFGRKKKEEVDEEKQPFVQHDDDDAINRAVRNEDNAAPSSPTVDIEKLTGKARVIHVALAARTIMFTPMYWVFVAHGTLTVTLGYYFVSNVATIASHLGATHQQATDSRVITTFMMSAIGFASYIPGQMIHYLGTRKGLVTALASEVFWLLVMCICFSIKNGGVGCLYAGYTAMFIWRVWGFGLSTPFLSWRFYRERSSIGFAYGFAYTVAGAVSAGWGTLAHKLVKDNADVYFFPIVVGTLIFCAVLQAGFACCVWKTTEADPVEEEHAEQAAGGSSQRE